MLRRPALTRMFMPLGPVAAAALLLTQPSGAYAQAASSDVSAALRSASGGDRDVRAFYAARNHRPLWVRGNALGPEADHVLELLETADADGLDPGDYRPRAVHSAIDKAQGGSPKALAKAEMLLSKSFSAYVRDIRRPRATGMVYVDRQLAPSAITPRAALDAAASAPSLNQYLLDAGWMNPTYGRLRRVLVADRPVSASLDARQVRLLRLNMDRARALPANPGRRYIVVDAVAARLWMYENGRVRDSMKVVVGKATEQTPMIAGLIRFAMVNPYWNIPPDLARLRVASGVLKDGPVFLKTKRYELLSDWSDKPEVLDPKTVDWRAVAAGRQELRARQLPGKDNAMGKMKFMFPNEQGIYLHDTPEKNLFAKPDRRFSSGCVRVEDAPRLAKWLFGKPLVVKPGGREKRVDLPTPVPVYITYLTAAPEGQTVVYRPDIYGRDAMPTRRGSRIAARR